ncbi:hypothetical protein [Nocardioides sp.]|uniref:hypothetical protein n=1 Tax=Nocardioides sp. TaxID=35761 RepID=UPI002D80D021|nr:hypothetical protein [Nocardioides sp.]HET8960286.1 hypothetical protein [Nocardioides sp.]
MLGAAHKPGAMPLRPLGLGDIYDAAFRIIRFNPTATVGAAVLVASVAMALPLLVTAVLTWTVDLSLSQSGAGFETAETAALVGAAGAFGVGMVLQWVGTILVTGMIAHVTAAAAIGRRLSLGEAWRVTHGKRWRLIGASLLIGLGSSVLIAAYVAVWFALAFAADGAAPLVVWGLVSVPAFICLLIWLWIRVGYLPVPALMLERVGVFGAFGRGFQLSRRQFWRIFGIALLTAVITGVASQVFATPISMLGEFVVTALGPQYEVLGLVVAQAIISVLTAAFVSPFTGAVTSLQYLDQRIRKEAYDVELMTQAGITAS